jgi:two-component system chemotaxis response regulator CheY
MSQKTVLVVDDSATIRQVVSVTLTQEGYEVVVASNGKEALRRLLETKVGLIITDINMPEMDGITLIRTVKSRKEFRFLPIVCLTSEDQKEFIPRAKEAGACAWIDKPFTPAQVLSITKRLYP